MPDPTGAEIAAHLRAGGTVEWWWHGSATWCVQTAPFGADAGWWDVAPRRDAAHPGCRLVPLPSKTERVPWHEALRDRRRLSDGQRVFQGGWRYGGSTANPVLIVERDGAPCGQVSVADDGTVEVLREQT